MKFLTIIHLKLPYSSLSDVLKFEIVQSLKVTKFTIKSKLLDKVITFSNMTSSFPIKMFLLYNIDIIFTLRLPITVLVHTRNTKVYLFH